MSRLDPPTVLLDPTFIAALTNLDEPYHAEAVATYADLLDRYEVEAILLVATSDSLDGIHVNVRKSLFAPVQELRIADQHRNASLDVIGPSAEDPDFATLLVALHREGVGCVATFDPRFDALQIETLPDRQASASNPASDGAQ
jgi:predicted nucleic acid-binding protein